MSKSFCGDYQKRIMTLWVNLAQVKEGDTIVDPFCGTGGILVEAHEFKIRTAGYDILKKCAWAQNKT